MHIIVKIEAAFIQFYDPIAQAFPEGKKTGVGVFHRIKGDQYLRFCHVFAIYLTGVKIGFFI